MAYKSMLLHVDDSEACGTRTRLAVELATAHEAHLTCFYGEPPFPAHLYVNRVIAMPAKEKRERAKARFEEQISRTRYPAEWRATDAEIPDAFLIHARYADLIILGQTDPDVELPSVPGDFPELVCLSVGRPVLVVPYTGVFPSIGGQVLIAWNGSREATRAVSDALPLLKRAKQVTVLVINADRYAHGEIPGADITWYLARHGVEAQAMQAVSEDAGELLLSRAADLSADLLVMGAYGHSRLKEMVLGGVTRTVLRSMTLPVLMSH
jgi:nucleotide-binding universal stress UspA family protein